MSDVGRLGVTTMRGREGLTLIELLIAAAIFVILLTGLAGLLASSLRAYRVNEQVSERVQDVEAAVRVLRADVELAGYRGVDENLIDDDTRSFGGQSTIVITTSTTADTLEVRYFEDRLFGASDRCGGVCRVRYEIREQGGTSVLFRIEGDGLAADQEGILRDMDSLKVLGFLNRSGASIPMASGAYSGTLSAINIALTLSDESEWVFPIAVPNVQLVTVN